MTVEEYLNIHEAGGMLKRSPAALRNLAYRKQIPYRKVAGRLTFLRSELEQWIDQAEGLRWEDIQIKRR
ncbi:MAG: helix-turn-helix domain-containing protein [Deltaproteobacteria bacterium]|nr:helix-turn-helix domain-containing protein [Deltaproteobacteria bacterium]